MHKIHKIIQKILNIFFFAKFTVTIICSKIKIRIFSLLKAWVPSATIVNSGFSLLTHMCSNWFTIIRISLFTIIRISSFLFYWNKENIQTIPDETMKSTKKVLMLEITDMRSNDIKYVYPDKLDNVNIDTVLKNHCEFTNCYYVLMMALVSVGKRYPHSWRLWTEK